MPKNQPLTREHKRPAVAWPELRLSYNPSICGMPLAPSSGSLPAPPYGPARRESGLAGTHHFR